MKKAFTLAEVLITLAVIGVIAALTIPNLMHKYKEKQTVTAVKTAYSILSDAVKMAVTENGDIESWGFGYSGSDYRQPAHKILADKIIPYLKVKKICGFNTGCIVDRYFSLDKRNNYGLREYAYSVILDNGMAVLFWGGPSGRGFVIIVDINNTQPPNQYGVDSFAFNVGSANILLPSNASKDENTFKNYCSLTKTGVNNGKECTAWVVYNENMDYLHCSDLSWNGKHKCSK